MTGQSDAERFEPHSPDEWSNWLTQHHQRGYGVWLVTARREAAKSVGYEQSVITALRFGWVDSTVKGIDEELSMMWFAPRRPQSLWTRPNKERIARLEAAGLLEPAGRSAVEAAKRNGNWSLLDDAEDGVVPPDLAAALDANAPAAQHWATFPPSAIKAAIAWVLTAKRPETRTTRIVKIVAAAERGERAAG